KIEQLGQLLPSLTELHFLRGSTLSSFRDLGTSLGALCILWLGACGVSDLDGVGALSGLRELYLAFNYVDDLTAIAMHDCLEVLDLESNRVSDIGQASQLGTCPRLWSLNLCANPVSGLRHYRQAVIAEVPHLESLDEEPVS
ncbi:unnamed protein product, partial [Discosporangium mesarthrocarpum]